MSAMRATALRVVARGVSRLRAGGHRGRVRPLLGIAALAAATATLAGCSALMPVPPATVQGRAINDLYSFMLIPTIMIFILVEGLLIWSVIRYRRRDDRLAPQIHGNTILEITWTAIPAGLVLLLFVLSMQTLGTVDAISSDPGVRVAVTGHQWYWDFVYEGKGVSISGAGQEPQLVLPVGEQVRFDLRSADVVHAFYVPAFLFNRDATPGTSTAFQITIDRAGVFNGQCNDYCGLGHATMRFSIRAVPLAEYTTWLAQQQAAAKASPSPAPSLGTGATTLQVSANSTTSFEQSSLTAPAGSPFAIHFTNDTPGVPHDVAIRDSSGAVRFQGTVVTGPASTTYAVPALPAGSYTFFCIVHPNMQGTLTVH